MRRRPPSIPGTLVLFVWASMGCGESARRSDGGADANPGVADAPGTIDLAVADAVADDASIVEAPAGVDGAVVATCSGDPSVLIWTDPRYRCGACESDMVFPLVCQGGYLACASSYPGAGDVLVTVPKEMYVLDGQNADQCAYMAPYYYPGLALWDPREATSTDRDPSRPIQLQAVSSYAPLPAWFRALFQDRATGEAVIRSLVTLTDVARGVDVPYAIGIPYLRDTATASELLDLTPVQPFAPGTHYRITLYPGSSQQLLACHTFGRPTVMRSSPAAALTAPETTDFYTTTR